MAIGTTAAILGGLAIAGAATAGAVIGSKSSGGGSDNKPKALPQPPSVSSASEKASETANRKRRTVTQSIYTSPLGLQGQASVAREGLKTKLGQ